MKVKATRAKRCKDKNKRGGPCRAYAGADGYCFIHSPGREAERAAARKKGGETPPSKVIKLGADFELRDGVEVRQLLAVVIREVMSAERNELNRTAIRARTVAYCATPLLRAYEKSDLEKRIATLEARAQARDRKGGRKGE